jgi:endonuclease/exonuclease/phosphatase (EEP) superfamily protein YafD
LPLIIGGDLNTHFGSREPAVRTVSKIAERKECGDQATHNLGFVLDHLFVRISDARRNLSCTRMNRTFGSDHYPLLLPLQMDW